MKTQLELNKALQGIINTKGGLVCVMLVGLAVVVFVVAVLVLDIVVVSIDVEKALKTDSMEKELGVECEIKINPEEKYEMCKTFRKNP